jgi:hypothetical protein
MSARESRNAIGRAGWRYEHLAPGANDHMIALLDEAPRDRKVGSVGKPEVRRPAMVKQVSESQERCADGKKRAPEGFTSPEAY